jgi:L-lactate dehydrogenase
VVGKNGIERIIELDLDEEECKALHRSAETLRRLNPRLSAGAA